jgi:hypothetical protein
MPVRMEIGYGLLAVMLIGLAVMLVWARRKRREQRRIRAGRPKR